MKVVLLIAILLALAGSSRARSSLGLSQQMVDILKRLLHERGGGSDGNGSSGGDEVTTTAAQDDDDDEVTTGATATSVPVPVVVVRTLTLFAELGGNVPPPPIPPQLYDNAFLAEPLDATNPQFYELFKQRVENLIIQLNNTLTLAEDTLTNLSPTDAITLAGALQYDVMPKVDALGNEYNKTLQVAIQLLIKGAIAGTIEDGASEQGCCLGDVTYSPMPDLICILNKAFQVTDAMTMAIAATYAQFYDKDTGIYDLEVCADVIGYFNSICWNKTHVDVSDGVRNVLSTIACTKRNIVKTVGNTLSNEDETKPLLSRILRVFAMVTVVGDEATYAFHQLQGLLCALQPDCIIDDLVPTMNSPRVARNMCAKKMFTNNIEYHQSSQLQADTNDIGPVDNFISYIKRQMENDE